MNYDNEDVFVIDEYRDMQRAVPGLDGLYRVMQAIVQSHLQDSDKVLIVGAGGGREIEALQKLDHHYVITGVDPSEKMLSLAERYITKQEQITLIHGTLGDVPQEPNFACVTAMLVMAMLPYTAKAEFIKGIYSRLKPGGVFIYADISYADADEFRRYKAVFLHHAVLNGLDSSAAETGPKVIHDLDVLSEPDTMALMKSTGFTDLTPFFRGLWYTGWWMTKPG